MYFLKHAIESSFLISIGILFHSLVAETAKERPPSVSLLYLGQTALMLEYLEFYTLQNLTPAFLSDRHESMASFCLLVFPL